MIKRTYDGAQRSVLLPAMEAQGLRPNQKLGQNFLVDPNVIPYAQIQIRELKKKKDAMLYLNWFEEMRATWPRREMKVRTNK